MLPSRSSKASARQSVFTTLPANMGCTPLLDDGMELLDADTLPLIEYPNLAPTPVRFKTMWAPELLQQVDCRITVGTFKRTILKDKPLISASLKNLYGLFPRSKYHARSLNSRGQLHQPSVPKILQDVYFCIGHLFDGAVVDADLRLISPRLETRSLVKRSSLVKYSLAPIR